MTHHRSRPILRAARRALGTTLSVSTLLVAAVARAQSAASPAPEVAPPAREVAPAAPPSAPAAPAAPAASLASTPIYVAPRVGALYYVKSPQGPDNKPIRIGDRDYDNSRHKIFDTYFIPTLSAGYSL